MPNYTISIQEDSNRVNALLDYLKSIDFVKISERSDWWETLTVEEQRAIYKSVDLLDNGEGINHSEVRKNVNSLLSKDE